MNALFRVFTRISAALLLASCSIADDRPYFAVVEKIAGKVGFYSDDGRRLGEIKVGNFPHEAVLSEDRRKLYVSDNGVLWMTEDGLGANTISVIDPSSMKRIDVIDLGKFHRPHGLALDKKGNLLATTERPFGLVLIDPRARRVVRDYDVQGKSPHMVTLGPDNEWAFVSNTDSSTVAAIHLAKGELKLIPTGARPQGGVIGRDGLLYIVCADANRISIIDPRRREIAGEIPTGKAPGRIAITPDGKTLVYNLQGDLAVGFADVGTRKQETVLPIDGRSLSLTMTQDGKRAFAGVQDQDKVVEISVPERKVLRVIQLPKEAGPDPVIPLRD